MRKRIDLGDRKVASREKVRDLPNLRDHGRTVDRPLLVLLSRLQERYGQAFASEGGLRKMIAEDTGHMPGVTTVAKALRRLGAQGLVVQVWLRAGQITPDGGELAHGTRLVFVPKSRKQRRAARAFNARQNRREGYETRHTGHHARELVARIAHAPPAPPARPTVDPFAAERARQLAAAREWAAANDEPEKPPE